MPPSGPSPAGDQKERSLLFKSPNPFGDRTFKGEKRISGHSWTLTFFLNKSRVCRQVLKSADHGIFFISFWPLPGIGKLLKFLIDFIGLDRH